MGLHDTSVVFWATYHGTSWDLAKGTGTVNGKPGHEYTGRRQLAFDSLSVHLVGVTTLSCRLDRTFKLLRSLQWTVLSSERSRMPAMVDSGEQITP